MPSGTGASTLSMLPDVPFSVDPARFMMLTERNEQPLDAIPTPGPASQSTFYLPKSGVASKLELVFTGTLTVTAAGTGQTQPTPSPRWPYGLLGGFKLGAGLGAELWDCDGLDLASLIHVNHPFFNEMVDLYPGGFMGSGGALAPGNYPVYLTYEVPLSVDQVSLVAALFLQSSSANVAGQILQAPMSDLIVAGGTTALWSISGSWIPKLTTWSIPVDQKGGLVLPDINHVHIGAGIRQPLLGTGRQPAAVQRTAGVLQRLFLRVENTRTSFLGAGPSFAAASSIDQVQINYGLTQTPLIFNPAALLASRNGRDYGQPLPYDTYVYDTVRENPARDAIILQGVTELKALVYPDPAVAVQPGAAVRLFEEILI
ncbi:MAG TPA: hypothetical protein VFP61_07625 [Acidimicrobiales bacterium]|nr:hypothetical protein [Acidimicrobiales bacterium]